MYKFLIALNFVILLSCTEMPVQIPDAEIPTSNRVVLIEDLTGVRCPNCPKGAAAIENILAKYKGKVVAVGIHGDFLTSPLPESKYDFRTPKSIALENFHSPFLGKPSALINRTLFDGETYVASDLVEQWESYIIKELEKEQEIEFTVKKSYNSDKRLFDFTIAATSLINETGRFNISVFVTESKIDDPQETQGAILEEYEHNHVFRDMLTNISGDEFATQLKKGETYTKSYKYEVPQNFNDKNMEIVVMVNRAFDGLTNVLQAHSIKIID
ncbi:MAG: hypothetical protein RLZZ546_2955 [Bacteroidota bacterium]|jgi:hypothetical protein